MLGILVIGSYIIIEAAVTGEGSTLTGYTGKEYGFLIGACLCDTACVFLATVAFQNDKSGFVSLLAYMSIFYVYTLDQFKFDKVLKGV